MPTTSRVVAPENLITLEIDSVAHGGYGVGRVDGRVVFVSGAIFGEQVLVEVFDRDPQARFWRGVVVEVLRSSPHRITPAWPEIVSTQVGGAQLAHVDLPGQEIWKHEVVSQQFNKLAKIQIAPVFVRAADELERGGWNWRTRFSLVADTSGRLGMSKFHTNEVVPLETMPLGSEKALSFCAANRIFERSYIPGQQVRVVAPSLSDASALLSSGKAWVDLATGKPPRNAIEQVQVGDFSETYQVASQGFWQIHKDAPTLLLAQVAAALADFGAGAKFLDLYSGSGLFSKFLAVKAGASGKVVAIESDATAVSNAKINTSTQPWVKHVKGDVGSVLKRNQYTKIDAVVLDPPRKGAGAKVINEIVKTGANTLVYVACDPASLARDAATLFALGFEMSGISILELFPNTHHMECVATFQKVS